MSSITRAALAQPTSRGFARRFATSRPSRAQNQIYTSIRKVFIHFIPYPIPISQGPADDRSKIPNSVRRPADFQNYQLLSSSSRTPLLTLWTTSWCGTCRVVAPLIKSLVESGVGEQEGGVAFCTVEYDAPDIMSGDGSGDTPLGMTYMITSIPTLLSFDAGEAMVETKVTDGRKLADREFLEEWIRNEARRHGGRGGGGGNGILGGLFGGWR
ncbi:hypothetical protein F5B22DRAFT_644399 [Xylaria bambusicola]|uniref:uncharacterized protein n=1 Tax=Xylaria bambusicola TaxID=326684 RepID=UPI002008DF60|nr:uncharacterized protein F5B22DRAFT_644399 [Xylaria bambusicola]KAI0521150.1 hypothetical protein F5B22DRAFT_644399 [Xylaria bambusicola]